MENSEYIKLAFAAFAHDIGKLLQRAEKNSSSSEQVHEKDKQKYCPISQKGNYLTHIHSAYTAYFLREMNIEEDVINVSAMHHISGKPNYFSRLQQEDEKIWLWHRYIQKADHFSSGLERENVENNSESELTLSSSSNWQHMFKVMLTSLLPNLFHSEKVTQYGYPVSHYPDGGWNNPLIEICEQAYTEQKDLYKELVDNYLEQAKKLQPLESMQEFNQFIALSERYLSFVPSATNVKHPNVSLFDHLKTTASIAGSSYLYNSYTKKWYQYGKYQLVDFHITGLESFIFNIIQSDVQSLAKTIRGRSTYAMLLPEVIGQFILTELQIANVHLLFSSPTSLRFLLPDHDIMQQLLANTLEKINSYLWNNHGDTIQCVYTSTSFTDKDNYHKKSIELTKQGELEKCHPHTQAIQTYGQDFFIQRIGQTPICQNCHIPLINEECRSCERYIALGETIVKEEVQFIHYYSTNNKRTQQLLHIPFGVLGEIILSSTTDTQADVTFDYNGKNNHGFVKSLKLSVPLKNDYVISLDELANQGKGDKKLAIVKIELPDYDYAFQFGLPESERTVSRLATLKKQFDYFIYDKVQAVLAQHNIYSVFTTNHSAVFIGSWYTTLQASQEILEQFHSYSKNAKLSLRIAYELISPTFPLRKAYMCIEKQMTQLLQSSKEISIFNQHFSLDEWKILIDRANVLKEFVDEKKISTTFLYKIMLMSQQAEKYGMDNPNIQLYFPYISYQIERNIKDKKVSKWLKAHLLVTENNQLPYIQYPIYIILRLNR